MEVIIKAFLPYHNDSLEKEDFFQESSTVLSPHVKVPAAALRDALLKREAMSTTGFEAGIAIPHGTVPSLKQAHVVFFRFTTPIEWDAMDGKPVTDCFMLLVPEEADSDIHLRLLSTLAYHLADGEEQEKIRNITEEKLMEEHLRQMMDTKGKE